MHEVLHSPAFFFSLHFESDHIFAHVAVQKLPKSSGTGIANVKDLPNFSSRLRVDQLHMPEEQVSW